MILNGEIISNDGCTVTAKNFGKKIIFDVDGYDTTHNYQMLMYALKELYCKLYPQNLTNDEEVLIDHPKTLNCCDDAKVVDTNCTALNTQVGGSHYKNYPIQPIEFFHKNKIPYPQAAIIKYVMRYKNKNGLEDLKKAKHIIDLIIEMEGYEDA